VANSWLLNYSPRSTLRTQIFSPCFLRELREARKAPAIFACTPWHLRPGQVWCRYKCGEKLIGPLFYPLPKKDAPGQPYCSSAGRGQMTLICLASNSTSRLRSISGYDLTIRLSRQWTVQCLDFIAAALPVLMIFCDAWVPFMNSGTIRMICNGPTCSAMHRSSRPSSGLESGAMMKPAPNRRPFIMEIISERCLMILSPYSMVASGAWL